MPQSLGEIIYHYLNVLNVMKIRCEARTAQKNIKQNELNSDAFIHDFEEWLENGKVGNKPKEREKLCNARVTCSHCNYVHEFLHNHVVKTWEN